MMRRSWPRGRTPRGLAAALVGPTVALVMGMLLPVTASALPVPSLGTGTARIAPGLLLHRSLPVDHAVELMAPPPRGALEAGLQGEVGAAYADVMRATRVGRFRDALSSAHKARALAYRAVQAGPTPRLLAQRHLARALYVEEQLGELVDLDRHLERQRDKLSPEERALYLHGRALLLHNQFLAVRAFAGQTDDRLLQRAIAAYESAQGRGSPLRTVAQIGYAALLAERGDRRAAQAAFARVSTDDQESERSDMAVAYYYLAMGDQAAAMARLEAAARRDNWEHSSATQDGRPVRGLVYRMNDFDRLREHPRFIRLVSAPEESGR